MSLNDLTVGSYTNRDKIGEMLDINLTGWSAVGINKVDDKVLLWVNLNKEHNQAQYNDSFLDKKKIFQWESQERQTEDSSDIKAIINKEVEVHLFCRISNVGPHTYMGKLKYMRHESSKPVKIYFISLDFDPSVKLLSEIYNHSPSRNRL
jgi:hypothetical protein